MAAENNQLNLNTPILDFRLPATDGKEYSPSDFLDADILIIIFMCNHCPYVKAVISRFIKLQKEYYDKGVRFLGINSNDDEGYPEDSFEKMKEFYKEWNMNFPYLRDKTQEVAKKFEAICTPDIYVYNKKRILKYRGRLDDNWKDESQVTSHDLKDAIDGLLSGKENIENQKTSIGCSIKWINK
jgi:peroxiredoxin